MPNRGDNPDEDATSEEEITALVPQRQFARNRLAERQQAILKQLHRGMPVDSPAYPQLNAVWTQLSGDWSWLVLVPGEPVGQPAGAPDRLGLRRRGAVRAPGAGPARIRARDDPGGRAQPDPLLRVVRLIQSKRRSTAPGTTTACGGGVAALDVSGAKNLFRTRNRFSKSASLSTE